MLEMNSITILMPVFNDWLSMSRLIEDLDAAFADSEITIDIVAVDDSSTIPAPDFRFANPLRIRELTLLHLGGNVGHQRAIAIGLSWLVSERRDARVAVMDSDGEDTPAELRRLLQKANNMPETIIVAQRQRRSETYAFKLFYQIYRLFFRVLTGHRINFGNFMVMPGRWVKRMVYEPNIWNNLAAAVVASRLPLEYVPTERGTRYQGESKMGFISLVSHGLSAIAVFAEIVFIRTCIGSMVLGLFAAIFAGWALFARIFTDLAIPGWTTTVMGFAITISIQAVLIPIMMAFLLLSNRSSVQTLPRDHALGLIETIDRFPLSEQVPE